MNVALIPPFSLLDTIKRQRHHLVLAHLIEQSQAYHRFYLEREDPWFITLDNSAHEFGRGNGIEKVWMIGLHIGADEIVIPDVLFDRQATLDSASSAINYIGKLTGDEYRPRIMFVPQGNSRVEVTRCVWDLVKLWQSRRDVNEYFEVTIGLSKDYEIWPGGLHRMLEEEVLPAARELDAFGTTQVHCLGWGRDLWALRHIAEDFGDRIRSVDSAKPFVYALNDIKLNSRYIDIPPYPKRTENYFESFFNQSQKLIADYNVEVFKATAGGHVI